MNSMSHIQGNEASSSSDGSQSQRTEEIVPARTNPDRTVGSAPESGDAVSSEHPVRSSAMSRGRAGAAVAMAERRTGQRPRTRAARWAEKVSLATAAPRENQEDLGEAASRPSVAAPPSTAPSAQGVASLHPEISPPTEPLPPAFCHADGDDGQGHRKCNGNKQKHIPSKDFLDEPRPEPTIADDSHEPPMTMGRTNHVGETATASGLPALQPGVVAIGTTTPGPNNDNEDQFNEDETSSREPSVPMITATVVEEARVAATAVIRADQNLRNRRIELGLCPECGTQLYELKRGFMGLWTSVTMLAMEGFADRGRCLQCNADVDPTGRNLVTDPEDPAFGLGADAAPVRSKLNKRKAFGVAVVVLLVLVAVAVAMGVTMGGKDKKDEDISLTRTSPVKNPTTSPTTSPTKKGRPRFSPSPFPTQPPSYSPTTTPTAQFIESKLTASDGAAGDYLGTSVAVSGNTIVVGPYRDDDKGSNSGSAYVFFWNGTAWEEQAKLTASDGAAGDYFGASVAVSGNTIVVGADGDDDKGRDSGSASIFFWNGMAWTEQAKLTASDGAADDSFGRSVAVSGNTIVVGAEGDDDKGSWSGSAYVFFWNGVAWTEQAKLTASDGAVDDSFGRSVAVSGNTLVVGAYGHDDKGSWSGSAYIFFWNGTAWTEQAKLTASDGAAGDYFGGSVAVSGNTIVVGARADDDKGIASRSAYVYISTGSDAIRTL